MGTYKILFVGDPHVTVEDLDDSQALLNLVFETVQDKKPDRVVFLGDLHHNHAIVRIEIIDFWRRNLACLSKIVNVTCLVGNHDRSHDSSQAAHALQSYQDTVSVVDKPTLIGPGILAIPYYHREEDFVEAANSTISKVLVCHQSFNGARFENGFYDPHGVDPDSVPQQAVIAGHIHCSQAFGKVYYPGSPRWRTAGDAGQDRHLWLVEFNDGEIINKTTIPTDTHCRKKIDLNFVEGELTELPEIRGPVSLSVSLHGSPEWVELQREVWSRRNVITKLFPKKKESPKIKESEGISVALQKTVETYEPRFGTPKEVLTKMAAERIVL